MRIVSPTFKQNKQSPFEDILYIPTSVLFPYFRKTAYGERIIIQKFTITVGSNIRKGMCIPEKPEEQHKNDPIPSVLKAPASTYECEKRKKEKADKRAG